MLIATVLSGTAILAISICSRLFLCETWQGIRETVKYIYIEHKNVFQLSAQFILYLLKIHSKIFKNRTLKPLKTHTNLS